MKTAPEYLVELTNLTGMSTDDWRDFLSLPPEAQALAAQNYRDQDWTKKGDTFLAVLSVLGLLATIAGDVSGLAGAASAVSALRAL